MYILKVQYILSDLGRLPVFEISLLSKHLSFQVRDRFDDTLNLFLNRKKYSQQERLSEDASQLHRTSQFNRCEQVSRKDSQRKNTIFITLFRAIHSPFNVSSPSFGTSSTNQKTCCVIIRASFSHSNALQIKFELLFSFFVMQYLNQKNNVNCNKHFTNM